jgi:hypothetical protein
VTTILELFGVLCLTVLAFFVWHPLALGVLGVAALFAAYVLELRGGRE